MSRFVEGEDRRQPALLPSCLDDYVSEDNPARVIDAFVDELDLGDLGFAVTPAAIGRPSYNPATLLKLYVYGYLNRVPSSRRLEREAGRNVEVMWLTGKLAPDHKTIANFRKDHGPAIQAACAHFVVLCRQIGLFTQALAAVDGSKFKAVNTRDKNFTATKLKKRMEQVAEHIAGYLADLDTADRQEGESAEARAGKLKDKIATLRAQMQALKAMETQVAASPDGQVSLTDPDARSMATSGRGSGIVGYNVQSVVEAEHHLIVAHDVVMTGSDRQQLAAMSQKAQAAIGRGRPRDAGRPRLLLRRRDRRLRGHRREALRPQAADLQRQGRGALRQAGLYLRGRAGRLSLPGRRASPPSHDDRGARPNAAPLLGPRELPVLRPKTPVHAQPRAARHPLGARGGDRGHAAADGPGATKPDEAQAQDRRTPLRHDQSLDGPHPLPDEAPEEREERDQPPHPGLQSQAGDADPRDCAAHRGDASLRESGFSRHAKPATRAQRRVFTQPRPGADVPRKSPARANASHHLVDVGALLGEVLSDTAYILTL